MSCKYIIKTTNDFYSHICKGPLSIVKQRILGSPKNLLVNSS